MTWKWKLVLAASLFFSFLNAVMYVLNIDLGPDPEQQRIESETRLNTLPPEPSEEDMVLINVSRWLDVFESNREVIEICSYAKANRTSKNKSLQNTAEFLWYRRDCDMNDVDDPASELKKSCEDLIANVTDESNELGYVRNFKLDPQASESKKELAENYKQIQKIQDQFCPKGDPV